ncbi:MAG: ABC transporter substrate-binding protein [Lachnospiraceae bacterium]|nr:ABC transporter substrate-binding protein [Lachnospiraceae bacterium]
MKRTKLLSAIFAIVMVVAMFALTACGGGNGGGGDVEPAGSGSAPAPAAGGTIVIGATGPLTGDASSYGISVNQGAQMAVDEINAAGGLNGIMLELKMKDDKAAATDAASAYDQLYDDGMQVSMGSVTSGACDAFAQRAVADGLFVLTPSASQQSIIEQGDTIFRLCFSDPEQGALAARDLAGKYEKIGVIYDTSDTYSTGLYEGFVAQMEELGKADAYTTRTFDQDNKKDFSAQVEALKDCDVIFCPFYYTEASLVCKACTNKGLTDMPIYGCDGLDGLAALLDDTIKNPITYITPLDVTSTDAKVAKFVEDYSARFGATPDQFAADGYDVIYVIFEALKAAGVDNADMSSADMSAAVTQVLAGGSFSYAGITGQMQWTAEGACDKILNVVQLQ